MKKDYQKKIREILDWQEIREPGFEAIFKIMEEVWEEGWQIGYKQGKEDKK